MKLSSLKQRNQALSLMEVLVVIAVFALLAALLLPKINDVRQHHGEIYCMMNLRKVDVAYILWANDHGGQFPDDVSVTNGGAMEPAMTGNAAACFQLLSHQLGSPSFLICPADTSHTAATNFQADFNGSHISYFVDLEANTAHLQDVLCGDANLAVRGIPVKSGLLELSTNAPVAWTTARHPYGGTIGFVDGHCVECRNPQLQSSLQVTLSDTNHFAIP